MKNPKLTDVIYWGTVVHAISIFLWFLIIPNIQMVYFATPYYWKDWSNARCVALGLYLTCSGASALIAIVFRCMP